MEAILPKYDYNLVVIGAGSAGLVSSYIASAIKAKVALIERHKMGGDCLNTGCVPSKALIRAAGLVETAKHAQSFGLNKMTVDYDFSTLMKRVHEVIKSIEPHDSVERYTSLGVECIQGEAEIISPHKVKVNGRILTTKAIIVASGAAPLVPPIAGLAEADYLTSDTIWDLTELPKRLVVLGGGPIGSELAQAFSRLGSKVTMVEMAPQILIREDEEVINTLIHRFEKQGIEVLCNHKAERFEGNKLICSHKEKEVTLEFDKIIIALGRKPNVSGFGLEKLGVTLTPNGSVSASPFLETNIKGIYVCGDVTSRYQFTHMAAHQAWFATVNALFAPFKRFKEDLRVVPWVTFTDPEIARVGLNEKQAKEQGIPHEVTQFEMKELDRAIIEGETDGLVKVLTVPGKDKILGVTLVGAHAGELIIEWVLAMKYGIGLNKILGTIHSYPTLVEANKYVAGSWKRAHAPEWALTLLQKFHQWRRG